MESFLKIEPSESPDSESWDSAFVVIRESLKDPENRSQVFGPASWSSAVSFIESAQERDDRPTKKLAGEFEGSPQADVKNAARIRSELAQVMEAVRREDD